MKRAWMLLAPLGALVVAGCSAMSEGECLTVDWHEEGLQDGRAGRSRSRLHDYEKACAEHGVRPDADIYYAAREIGLQYYCTPESGYQSGRNGYVYYGVCPLETETAFRDAYREGQRLFRVEEQMKSITLEISTNESKIADEDTSEEERKRLQEEVRRLNSLYRLLSDQLIDMERNSRYQ